METIAALKSVIHLDHDEHKHPRNQGFASPMVIGIVAYAFSLSLALGCVAIFSAIT